MNQNDELSLDNYTWFGYNRSEIHRQAPTASGGVGLLVKNELKKLYNIDVIDREYEGILTLKFTNKLSDFEFIVVSCYLPPENSPWGRDSFGFYNHLLKLVYMYSEVDSFIILGDLNSRIGNLKDYMEECDSLPARAINIDNTVNNHGRELIEFLCDSKTCILNGRLNVPDSNNFTFSSTRGNSVVDYIICTHDSLNLFDKLKIEYCSDIVERLSAESLIGPNSRLPDHALMSVCLTPLFSMVDNTCNVNVSESRKKYKTKNIPQSFLSHDNVALAITEIITKIQSARDDQASVNEIYTNLLTLIIDEMNDKLLIPSAPKSSKKFKFYKPYWNEELGKLWQEMHQCEVEARQFKGPRRVKQQLHSLFINKQFLFDKRLKQLKRQYDRGVLLNIDTLQTNDPKVFWQEISKLGPKTHRKIPMEYPINGNEILTDENEVLNKWKYDFEELYKNTCDDYDDSHLHDCKIHLTLKENNMNDPLYVPNAQLNDVIHMSELEYVLHKLHNNKSPGPDRVPYEIWKNVNLREVMLAFFQYCFDVGRIPVDWTRATINPIPKPGKKDYRLPSAYRGISLLACIYKIYSSVLNNRIQKYLETGHILCDQQNGFRANRSCEDHIFVMDSLINTRLKDNKSLYAAFIDFTKAFDLVDRDLLFLQLLNNGLDGNLYFALKSLYVQTSANIRVNNYTTDWFDINNGVRQGDPLSPTLFSIFINDLIKEVEQAGIGVKYLNDIINILVFADDVVVLAENPDDLQILLDIVSQWCSKWRLSTNNDKSAVVHFRKSRIQRCTKVFTLQNRALLTVPNYKYLGIILNEHHDYQHAVNPLCVAAGRALGGIIHKFRSFKNIGYSTFSKLYDSCVTPILEYGAAVWGANRKYECVDRVMYRALRYYLGVHRFAPVAGLVGDMGFIPHEVGRTVASLRLWNRLVKLDDNRITKKVFNYDYQQQGSFSHFIEVVCSKLDMEQAYLEKGVLDLKSCKEKLLLDVNEKWATQVDSKPKLRLYKVIKTSPRVENYCKWLLPRFQRSLLCQLRVGILPLQVELGRFTNTPLEERTCKICDQDVVENELHFVFDCSYYNVERNLFLRCLSNTHQNHLITMSKEEKLKFLFEHYLLQLAKYIQQIFIKRRNYIYR